MNIQEPHSPPAASSKAARVCAWLTFGFIGLAFYGSLVPFHFQYISPQEACRRFQAVLQQPVRIGSRSDWLANTLLFVPAGFFFLGALSVHQPRSFAWLAVLAVVPLGAACSVLIEFSQIFFPPRVCSLNDIAAQGLGTVLGVIGWLAVGPEVTIWLRKTWSHPQRQGLALRLFWGYLVFLVLVQAMPFDLTISPADLYRRFRDGKVHLLPFGPHQESFLELAIKQFWNVAYFFPLGLLLGGCQPRALHGSGSGFRVLGLGVLLAGSIEFLQLFVAGRNCDSTDVITGSLAVLAGWGVMKWFRRGAEVSEPVSPGNFSVPWSFSAWRGFWLACLLVWLGILVFLNWQPFDFTVNPQAISGRLQQISLLPFADYVRGDYGNALDQVLQKTLLFLPLGTFLTLLCPLADRRLGALLVVMAGLLLAAGLEAGQLFLPTRYPSLTDVLVETSAAWIGWKAADHFRLALAGPTFVERKQSELCR